MTLRSGRQFLSIPGPTTVPDEVLRAMHRPAIDIYGGEGGGELLDITISSLKDLKTIFRTQGDTYIYVANGHGAWEGSVANVLSRGDTILVLESGRFAVGWGEFARNMGVNVERLQGDWRRAVDPQKVEDALRADTEGRIKALLVVQIDTASGCVNDIPAIRAAMDAAGHDALLMVDTIASLACMPFNMDEWGVDVAVGGSQKGLMTPPGLSFVAANAKAKERHQTADLRTSYWDWSNRDLEEHYRKYSGTPPVHLLFGLRKAMDMILEEGLENIFERHKLLAGATHAAVEVWRQGGSFDFNIAEPSERSCSVTTLRLHDDLRPEPIRAFCFDRLGVTLGLGIGDLSGKAFRIAHMGHVNAPMMLGTLGSLEVALDSLGLIDNVSKGGIAQATAFLADALRT
ncbi:MAG: alanine--glyoxylate aminotransferase family protein [Rhodospirillales bacterium]|nr:alanine--glyoxylate aminotransferase family protein [Rhodospirillales bacterium]MBO6785463.1 alanine--glyoxylate aminotransferase family protein [Rhodospirillales bacterium]